MPNTNNPSGFTPLFHLCGGEIRSRPYVVATGATVFENDVVSLTSAGTIQAASAGAGGVCVGVAATYGTAGQVVQVHDDPFIVFGVQCDGALAASNVGEVYDHIAGSGNTTTKISGHTLNSTADANTINFRLLGLVSTPGNAWGAYQDVMVIFNQHAYKTNTAAI